jgi:hypothetical protein
MKVSSSSKMLVARFFELSPEDAGVVLLEGSS